MQRLWILLAVLSPMSCSSETTPSPRPSEIDRSTEKASPSSPASLDEEIRAHGSVVFRSWNGRWRGTDIDTDLQFLPDHRVKVIEYGEGVETYRGTYRVANDGELAVSLEGYRGSCPVMLLRRDPRSLYLVPKDPGLKPAVRDRFTVLSDISSDFWPFRRISTAERSRFHD